MSVNYLSLESNTFFLCQNCGHGESSSPHQHTLICNGGPDRQSTRTQTRRHARAHARAQAGAVSARRSVCKIRHSIHLLVLFPATTVTLLYSGDFPTQTCQSRRSASLFFIRFGVPTWLFPLRPHLTFHSPPPSGWQRFSVYAFSPLLHWHGRNVPRTLSEVFQVWPAMLAALKKKKKKKPKKQKKKMGLMGWVANRR